MQIKAKDTAQSQEALTAKQLIELAEKGKWIGEFSLTKFDFTTSDGVINTEAQKAFEADSKAGMTFEQLKSKYAPYFKESKVIGRNLLTNYGINSIIWNLVAGGGATAMNNANARLGVGDSSTAAAATQTDLQAASNKTYVAMDATYPTYGSSQQIIFRATYGSGSANYAWNEFISDNGTAGHAMNRLTSTQGTKTSGQSWQLSLTITLS